MGVYEMQPALYTAYAFPDEKILKILFELVPATIIIPSSALTSLRDRDPIKNQDREGTQAQLPIWPTPAAQTWTQMIKSFKPIVRELSLKSQPCHQPGR